MRGRHRIGICWLLLSQQIDTSAPQAGASERSRIGVLSGLFHQQIVSLEQEAICDASPPSSQAGATCQPDATRTPYPQAEILTTETHRLQRWLVFSGRLLTTAIKDPNSHSNSHYPKRREGQLSPPLVLVHFAQFMAPEVGLEPTTLRLTAECSAIELLRIVCKCRPPGGCSSFFIANAGGWVKERYPTHQLNEVLYVAYQPVESLQS